MLSCTAQRVLGTMSSNTPPHADSVGVAGRDVLRRELQVARHRGRHLEQQLMVKEVGRSAFRSPRRN